MESPIILIVGVIQYFILSIIVGGIIFNISFQQKKFTMFSLISSVIVYLLRNLFITLSIPIGLNVFVNLILTILIFKYIFKFDSYKRPFQVSMLIFIVMIINEALTLQPTLNLLKTNIQSVLNNTTLHFQATMIQNLGLLMIMLIVYIVKKYIVDRRDVFIDN